MSDRFLSRTNSTDATDALRTFSREVRRSGTDIYAWKWATIALHNAIQNVCIVVLEQGNQFQIYGPKKEPKFSGLWESVLKSVGNPGEQGAWEAAQVEGRLNTSSIDALCKQLSKAHLAEGQVLFHQAIEGVPLGPDSPARDWFNELSINRNDLLHLRGGVTLKPADLRQLAEQLLPVLHSLAAARALRLYEDPDFRAALNEATSVLALVE